MTRFHRLVAGAALVSCAIAAPVSPVRAQTLNFSSSVPAGACGGDLGGTYPNCTVTGYSGTTTGTGSIVRQTSPSLVTPALGAASATSLSLSTALPGSSGGTGTGTYAVGDVLYADTTSSLARLAGTTAGAYLRAAGANTAPAWSSIFLSNALTTGDLWSASGTNTMSRITAVAAGQVLISQGTSTLPAWSNSPSVTKLTLAGNMVLTGIETDTNSATITATNSIVICNKATAMTETIPTSGFAVGQVLWVKNIGAGGCTVDSNTGNKIDNAQTYVLSAQWQSVTMFCQTISGSQCTQWLIN